MLVLDGDFSQQSVQTCITTLRISIKSSRCRGLDGDSLQPSKEAPVCLFQSRCYELIDLGSMIALVAGNFALQRCDLLGLVLLVRCVRLPARHGVGKCIDVWKTELACCPQIESDQSKQVDGDNKKWLAETSACGIID